MKNNQLWEDILETIKSEISPKAFMTWFKDSSLEINENNHVTIFMANEFASDWVRKNYSQLINTSAEKILEKKLEIGITTK